MVSDAKVTANFYTEYLDFEIELAVPAIYIVSRGDTTLLLSGPKSSARRPQCPTDASLSREVGTAF